MHLQRELLRNVNNLFTYYTSEWWKKPLHKHILRKRFVGLIIIAKNIQITNIMNSTNEH